MTHIMSTDAMAPSTSARYHPNDILCDEKRIEFKQFSEIFPPDEFTYLRVDGRPAIHMANNDIMKLAKSVSKWAASVAMAKLFDHTPPTISKHMNITHKILAIINFFLATKSMPSNRSSRWQWSVRSGKKWRKVNYSNVVGRMEVPRGRPDDAHTFDLCDFDNLFVATAFRGTSMQTVNYRW